MAENTKAFPEGWFMIKNLNNGFVLSLEEGSHSTGARVVLTSLNIKDIKETTLWRVDDQQRLVNKQTGQVMDISNGKVKSGTDIVQQIASTKGEHNQSFGLNTDGHIFVKKSPNFVLGIKEPLLFGREGLPCHLQSRSSRKEQKWDFVIPVLKQSSSIHSSVASLKKSDSISTTGSLDDAASISSSVDYQDEQNKSITTGYFPPNEFFIKSVSNGYYIGADASEVTKAGAALSIDKFRKSSYKSQLWTYESTTHRIVNKLSGLVLSASNDLKEDTHVHQMAVGATKYQEWQWTKSGQLCLKDHPDWVLGFKTSVFNISREGAHLYIQKADVKKAQMQTFQVVLPIFKEHSSTTTVTETPRGQFPDGWFFVKSQAHGLVLSVLDSGTLAAEATAVRLDVASYSRQLWKYKNGFLVNKASNYVLDVKGGDIFSGATLCQYKEKKKDNANQQWGLNMDHSIFTKANSKYVLTLQENESVRSKVFLAEKSAKAVKEQTWNFVLPVFKKKKGEQVTKTTTVVKKTVIHRYVHYPRGWFFIRSSLPGTTLENAQVLTANADKQTVRISALDREKWHAQLWTFVDGSIVNYETQLAINVNALNVGETVKQSVQQNLSKKQSWALTTEGHFIQLGEPTLGVVPSEDGSLVLKHIDHLQQQTSRWDLLEPQFKYEHRTQILISWKISLLKEWRNVNSATIHTQKVTPSVASWPEDIFYITTGQGDALVPDKNEAHSSLTSRALKTENHESFRWCFRNGYLVHVATGLVLHARDLTNSSGLEIRAQETDKDGHVHQNQSWIIHTDGSIISATNKLLGLGGHKFIELCDIKKARQHISWSVVIGHYEKDVLISFRRYILTIATIKSSSQHELVTRSYGVFPEQWIFIRSKQDSNLVITAKTTKEGARLVLSKLDFQNFKQQLWHIRDDSCLVNYASNLVIDIAGGQIIRGANIIQYSEKLWRRSRKNQMWGLSVDGHIHPESRNGLVLAPKQALQEGVELTLASRGALDRHEQQWTFAAPVFRNKSGAMINVGLTGNKVITDVIVNGITEATISQTDRHVYRRTVKKTVVRRWGIFPDNEFFVRLNYGTERYALTVEKEATKENEHQVTLRAMNYKEYKYQLWSYRDGHLVNSQTGLALELEQEGKDVLIESGLQAPAVVREFSMSENQFFALGIRGEIHLQSNSRLLIAVAHEERATFDGAQLGAKRIKVNREVKDNKEETTLKSSEWMRWSFSTPVFKKVTDANGVVTEVLEHECKDHSLHTKENDDTCSENDVSDDDDSEDDSDDDLDESEDDGELLDYDDDKVLTDASDSGISNRSRTSQSKRHSYRLEKKGSFVLPDDYVPTGFEKVERIKDHQATNFPTSGYFFIKNKLHGYYLEAEEDKAHTNIKVVLSQLKSTDFASQLWSYKDGFLYNLKYGALVLDASAAEVTTAGDLVHLSKASATIEDANDQQWGWLNEGVIYLKARRSFILSIKEAVSSTKHNCVDVFVLEEKPRLKAKSPRPEQSWTLQIPSLIPTAASASGSKVVVPDTKSSSSSLSTALTIAGAAAISTLSYKWFSKLTRVTTITTTHWSEKWFMISYGSNNLFLGAGLDKDQAVGLYQLKESDDQKRFLWTFVDGYLVNYRYSLRLVFCLKTQRWLLTDSETEYDQQFSIDTNGVITLRIHKIIYYLRFVYNSSGETLLEITENAHDACQHWQLHAPEFSNEKDVTEANEAKTKIHTVIREQQQRRRITTITTTTWTITQRRAYFPDSPWFFIKINVEGNKDSRDDYVLAQDEATHSLFIKKISFTQFKSQLWTWRDNNLINYGSSLAIGIKDNNLTLTTSGYKWVLNADGNIHTEESNGDILVLGYEGTELKDNTIVKLYTAKKSESTNYTLIRWGFTTPVFGKRKTDTSATTTTSATSQQETHASITASIEQGATIDTLETVQVTKQKEDHYTSEINNMTIVTVEHVRIVVRTWWLRLVQSITERAEKEGASEEEIKTIIAKEKETLYAKLDKATSSTTDKRVSEELAIAIKESKTLVEQQTTEAHNCAVQVIKSTDKKAKVEELNKLTKVTEEKLNITITEEKVKQAVQKETVVANTHECHSDVAIVNVETVRITVRTWWLRLVQSITERAEKEGASEEEIKTIIAKEKETLYAKLDKATSNTTDKRVSEELAIAIKESKTLVEQQTTEAHNCAVQVIKSTDKKAKVEELNKLTKVTEEKLNITITEEKVKQTVQKTTEKDKEHHDHSTAIAVGAGAAAIAVIGGAGAIIKKHHDDKVETEKAQKETTVVESHEGHSDVAIVNVETVRITVRTWWLRLVQSITERAEKEGASEEEIKTIIAKEKETLYAKLDKATSNTTDKRVSEELAIAIKESKTLVEQQTTEAHNCAVQVIKSTDKKAKVEELNKLTKVTEEKLNITITEEKVKQTVQKTTEKDKEHHDHSTAIAVGAGAAAIGVIAGGAIALKKHHDHEKEEAEKKKTEKITVVEVTHDVTKPVVKVDEKKSETVVVVDVEKSKNTATEHVNVVKDNVHGWFSGFTGRVNERIQKGGDEAKTKADIEKITKDARDELHVIIKDSKEKTKAAEGVLVTEDSHAEFEKTITEVHEAVAGKITEVETIVKEHKDTEIKGKLDEIVEKNKTHVNEKLDKSTTVIHQHIEKVKKPEEHHDHSTAIAVGTGAAAIAVIGGAGAVIKKHHDDKVETEKIQKETTVVESHEGHSDVAIVNVETVRITVRTWWLRLVQSITERAEKEGASEEEIKTIIAKEKETLYAKLDKATSSATDKRVSEELAIAIKESKTLVEQQTTEAHNCAVQVIKSTDKKAKVEELNKLTKVTEEKLNITITEEKVKQTVQKTTEKDKEHHDHSTAIAVGAGAAAIGVIAGGAIALKKHHDHEKEEAEKKKTEKTTVVEVTHDVTKPVVKVDEKKSEAVVVVDVEKSKNTATEHVNVVKDNVHGWFSGFTGRVNERIQKGGDEAKTKADIEKITKDARDELHVIIKDSKEKTKAAEGVLVTEDSHAEFEKTITEVHEAVAGKITEVETIVKEHKDTEIKGKLDDIVEKNKTHVNEKLDKSTTVIHQHIEKVKKPEEHHDHSTAIAVGTGAAAIAVIGGAGAIIKKHHDDKVETEKIQKETVVAGTHECHSDVAIVNVETVRITVRTWWLRLVQSITERAEKEGASEEEIKTIIAKEKETLYAKLDKATSSATDKRVSEELAIAIKESKTLVEQQTTEAHNCAVQVIKSTDKKAKVEELNKLTKVTEEKLNITITEEKVKQTVQKTTEKDKEHHDHSTAIAVGAGAAAIGVIAGGAIALKKHHDHEKEKAEKQKTEKITIVEVKHEATKPVVKVDEKKSEAVVVVDVEKSKNTATEHVNVVKDNVHGWFSGFTGRVNERIQKGGDEAKTKADIEKITKDARDELHVIIKDSKEKTKAAEGVLVTEDSHAEFEKTITEVHEAVAGKITEVETIVKEHKDTEIKGKLDEIVEKNKTHVNEKLDKSTTVIHQHIEKVKKPEEHHDHSTAIAVGTGAAAIGVIAGGAIALKKHHDHEKEEAEKKKTEKITVVEVTHDVTKPVVKVEEKKSEAVVVVDVEKSKNTATEHVNVVKDNVHGWFSGFTGRVNERIQKGGDEAKTKADIEKITKDARDELHVIIKDSKEKTKAAEGVLVTEDSHAEFEKTITEVHEAVAGKITEVETIVKEHKDTEIKGKLDDIVEKNKTHVNEKLDKSTTVIHQHIEKVKKPEEHHDHSTAIAVGTGAAAIAVIGGAGAIIKKHHDDKVETEKIQKETVVAGTHECHSDVAIVNVETVRITVRTWWLRLVQSITERAEKEGASEEEIKTIIAKEKETLYAKLDKATSSATDKRVSEELAIAIKESKTLVEQQTTEAHNCAVQVIKSTDKKAKVEELNKLTKVTEEKLNITITEEKVKQTVQKTTEKDKEHHDHSTAIAVGAGAAAIGVIAGGAIALKKHHDHEKEKAEKQKTEKITIVEVKHEATKPVVKVDEKKSEAVVVVDVEKSKNTATEHVNVVKDNVHGWFSGFTGRVNERIQKGGDEAKTKADIEKITKDARDELHVIIKDSKEKTKAAEGVLVTEDSHAEFEKTITEVHEAVAGKITEVETIVKEHKDTEIKGKLDEIVEKNKTHVNEKLDKSTTVIHQHIEKVKKPEEHHDHSTAIAVGTGAAAIAVIGGAGAVIKKHHDDKVETEKIQKETTVVESHEGHSDVAIVNVETVRITVRTWWLRLVQSITERAEKEGASEEEIKTIIAKEKETLYAKLDKATSSATDKRVSEELAIAIKESKTLVEQQTTEAHNCAVQVIKSTDKKAKVEELNKLTKVTEEKLNITITEEKVKQTVQKTTEKDKEHHDHSTAIAVGAGAAAIAVIGGAGAIIKKHHDDKVETEKAQKETTVVESHEGHSDVAIVNVETVRITVRTWWLRLVQSITERAEKEGASEEEIKTIIAKEKETLYAKLDKATSNTTDKRVSEELAIAIKESKTLVEQQTTEAHNCAVQVIKSTDKKAKVEELNKLNKVTEEKLNITITEEKVKQTVQKTTEKDKEHHDHSTAIAVGAGAAAIGVIAGGAIALKKHHDHEKEEAEKKKTEKTTVVEVTHDVTKPVVKVDEKKSEAVVVVDVEKSKNTATEHVNVVKDNVHGWFSGFTGRVNERIQKGGDEAKTKADIEKITKDARDELHVIIKDSKEKTKAAEGVLVTEDSHAEFEKTITEVHEAVAGKITEVETIVKEHKDTEIKGKLDDIVEKNKTHVNEKLDKSTTVIHQHIEKVKKPEEHHDHSTAIAVGTGAAAIAVIGGAGAIIKKHHDDKVETEKIQKETVVAGTHECHSDVAIVNVETVRITVRTWWLRLVQSITERAEKEGASEEEIKTIIAKEKETLYAKLDKATSSATDKRVSEELAIAIKESKTLVEQQTTEAHNCAVQVIKSTDKKAKVEELNKLTKVTEEKLNITITEEKVKQTVQKTTEKDKEHHDHSTAIAVGAGAAAIGVIAGGAIALKKHHDHEKEKAEKQKTEKITIVEVKHEATKPVVKVDEKKSEAVVVVDVEKSKNTATEHVNVVKDNVHGWFSGFTGRVNERIQKGGDEAKTKADIEKITKDARDELHVIIKDSKEKTKAAEGVLVTEDSHAEFEKTITEVHEAVAGKITEVETIVKEHKDTEIKGKLDDIVEKNKTHVNEKLDKSTTVIHQHIEKVKKPEEHHDHSTAISVGAGAAAIGVIAGGAIALKKHHDHEKEAEKQKTEKTTVIEVTHDVTKPVVKVDEKKSEAVVVVDVEKSKNTATEHVNVVKDNVHGWFSGFTGRVNERIQKGGDEAKTKADIEKITKDARDELHVIIKDSKEKTKAAEGVLVTEDSHAEFEKTITEVHEAVAGKITEVETIVKEHKDTEIKGKLDEIVEKNKTHVNEKLDKSTTVIHQHIEKVKKPEEHHDHSTAIAVGTGAAAIAVIGGAGAIIKKHHDDKVETEKIQKETVVAGTHECHSDVAIVNVETVRITVRTWWLRLVQSITERAEKEGASEEEIKTIIAKEKETLYAKLDKATSSATDKRVSEELAIAIKESKTLVEQQTTEAHNCAVQVIKSTDKKAKVEELNKLTKVTEEKLNITITEEKVKQTVQKTTEKDKEHHDHSTAIAVGAGAAAIGVIAGGAIALKKHHDHEKEEAEKKKTEKTTVVEVTHDVTKPVVKVEEKKSEAVVVVDVEKSKNTATEHVNVVKDNVHGWFSGFTGRVNERIQKGGDEAKTKADIEKITKDARDELHVIIKDSKEKTKAAEGVLVTEDSHAEFEKTITEVHEAVAGKITEVETIVKEHKDTEIKGKLDDIVEKNKTHVNEKLDKSTTVIHQHIEKVKKPEEHHDHSTAISVGAGAAAIGVIAGGAIALKKHHDHEKEEAEKKKTEKTTVVEVTHDVTKPVVKVDEKKSEAVVVVDVEKSKNTATEHVNVVKDNVHGWFSGFTGRVNERIQKGGDEAKTKADIEKITKDARDELHVIIKDSKEKTKAAEGVLVTEDSHAEFEKTITEVHEAVAGKITEVETIVKEHKDTEIKGKLDDIVEKNKTHVNEKLDKSTTVIHQHIEKVKKPEEHHDHSTAISVGAGAAAIGVIAGGAIALKKHHDHEKEEAEKKKTEKTTVVEVTHDVTKPVVKVDEKKSEAVVVVDVEKSKNTATEHVNVVKDNVHGWFSGFTGRVNERIQKGGDEAKTKADIEKITKDARDELHVIIKDSKEKTKAAEGVLVTEDSHAEFEKTITEVHEAVAGKITEVETIVKEHKDTEIKGKLDEIVEKNKTHVNEKLDKSTTVIHQHIEKVKKPEEHHDHSTAIAVGTGAAAIAVIGGAGAIIKKHHDDKVETEKIQKETVVAGTHECHSDVAIVNVETVRITVRTWWLRLVQSITERAEKEGASEEEIKTIIAKEKETLYAKLDKATSSATDKRVSEELAIAIKESKTLVEQQTTEAHNCAVQVIKSTDKKAKVEELNKLTKVTEEKLNITITEEKVKQTVQKTTEKDKEHHDHSTAIAVGAGAAAIGVIAGGAIALKKHHDHEKEEAEKKKTEKTTVVEVTHDVTKPVVKVDEKKSEAVVVVDVEKSKNTATEHVNVVKDNVHGWFSGFTGRVNERIQKGGDEAKTKADIEKITKDARDELHVIIKDSKEKTKAAEGVLVTEDSHAEFEKTITEVHEAVAGKITEVETIVKEHKDTEIKGKLDEIVEKNKTHVNEKLDKSTTVIHQHIEKVKKPEEHHDHSTAISVGTGAVAIGVIGGGAIALKKHHDHEKEDAQKQKVSVVESLEIISVEDVKVSTKEQVKNDTSKLLTLALSESDVRISGWIDQLIVKIQIIITRGNASAQEDILKLIESAQKEYITIVEESKQKITTQVETASIKQTDEEVITQITNAQKYALSSYDNISLLIKSQLEALTVAVKETKDLQVLNERTSWILTRTKKHSEKTLKHTTESSISAAFEGKTITWVETAQIPESFGSVKIFVFDVLDSVIDIHGSLLTAWLKLSEKKKGGIAKLNAREVIQKWYIAFLEEKKKQGKSSKDKEIIRATLLHILKEYSVECLFNDEELRYLVTAWERLDIFGDATNSISQLKKGGVYAVAMSSELSTRSMMTLARHGCLCWHSQFSSDVASTTVDAYALLETTADYLDLENKSELAIVSSNTTTLEAAKKHGMHTVLIDRQDLHTDNHFDATFDGLDILAESYQVFSDHHSKQLTQSRTWIQRIIDTATEIF